MKRKMYFKNKGTNPVIKADFPDPDIIRVGDVYYMISTTIHFLPGAVILRSYDLLHWEIASYVFDTFEGTEEARMTNERSNYGCGMWAGSLKYHKGCFYVTFAAKETGRTYFYKSTDIEGPWEQHYIDFYFHQGALFFDDDDRVYLVFGHREIWMREMEPDLSGMKPGGFARKLLEAPREEMWLPDEGVHFHKIDGVYYLFTIRWPKGGTGRRVQMCYRSETLDGEFTGGVVLDDTLGLDNNGVAQGGLVQTNDGRWYSMMTQDRGAAGRFPVLVPVDFSGQMPVFGVNGRVPEQIEVTDNRPHYEYEPLWCSDDFHYEVDEFGHAMLKKQWQWNHEPNPEFWEVLPEGGLKLTSGKICTNVTQTINTLTQRLMYPKCSVEVTVDAGDLNEGDYAGICALQGCYGMLAVSRELRRFYLTMMEREDNEKNRNTRLPDYMPGIVTERVNLMEPVVRLRMDVDFRENAETVSFYYREPMQGGKWRKIGEPHRIYFGLDHFAGCRVGLSLYATKKIGGSALFRDFVYKYSES